MTSTTSPSNASADTDVLDALTAEKDQQVLNELKRLEVRFNEVALQARIQELAAEINQTFAGTQRLTIIAILKGSFMFLSDLVKHLDVPCHIEFVRLASYGNEKKSSGTVKPVDLSLPNLKGRDVLVVEDIIDTGLTIKFFVDYVSSLHQTNRLKLAVLLDKTCARTHDVPIDFAGFEVGDEFLVGYGLDYAGYGRNLPYIGVIPPAADA